LKAGYGPWWNNAIGTSGKFSLEKSCKFVKCDRTVSARCSVWAYESKGLWLPEEPRIEASQAMSPPTSIKAAARATR